MLSDQIIREFEQQHFSFEAPDADAISGWVSQRHKGLRATLLEPPSSGPVARFARKEIDDISLVNFRWYQACHSVLLEDLDAYFVCIPHSGVMKMETAQKDEIIQTTQNLRVYKRAAGVKNTVAAGFSNLSLVVPAQLLESRIEEKFDLRLREPLNFAPLIDASRGPGRSLVSFAMHLLTLTNFSPVTLQSKILRTSIKEQLLSVMLECLPHNYSGVATNTSETARPRSVARAEDYMLAHCSEPITLADLAHEAGCSERALQNAFRSYRQAGPMQTLRSIRLQAAHNDLMHSDASVTDIALKWGFGNLGRFARHYSEKYGQNPSQVKRSRKSPTK